VSASEHEVAIRIITANAIMIATNSASVALAAIRASHFHPMVVIAHIVHLLSYLYIREVYT
jgi:hypothetical protein